MSLSKSVGRPPKYPDTSLMHIVVPSELKKFLRDLSRRTGKSMSELIVEALLNYYKEVKVGKIRVRERKRAIDVMRELEIKRIEKELRLREKNVKTLEDARAQGIMHVKVGMGGMTVIVWDAIVREQNRLHGLMKKIVGLEKFGLDLYDYAVRVRELIERLEKIK